MSGGAGGELTDLGAGSGVMSGGAGGGLTDLGAGGGVMSGVLVAGSLTSVLLKVTVSTVLVKGSVSWVLAAVAVVAVHVAVAVLSTMQVGGDMPFFFRPFPTLDGGAAVLPLPTVVLSKPLVAGVLAFSLRDVGNFFCFGGGGMSLASVLGTLAAQLLGALQKPVTAGTTVPGDVVAEVLGLVLERRIVRDRRGVGGEGKRSRFDRKSFLETVGWVDGWDLGVEEEVVVVGVVHLLTLAVGCREVDGCWVGV
ncbi:hypothetical protein NDU88_003262 [Pleurodeles waltl]|uniref:Uncharacterized protein n=1 Tax=Pleurodeles waltl TaxID=8319 RepID=A0AAV7WR01_PLEWA|nr:hypothetical protein NDU88_003262 [Pleurodeles waltl]